MKTRELIRLLQEADPEGETHVVVGGASVYYVEKLEGYYDGSYEVLIEDPAKKPYYAVCGAQIRRDGHKVNITTLSIEDAIHNDPRLPVEVFTCEPNAEFGEREKAYLTTVARWREEALKVKHNVEAWMFASWAKSRGLDHDRALAFFESSGMTSEDPMPDDIRLQGATEKWSHGQSYHVYPSWADRRRQQWDREVHIAADGTWTLKR